MFDPFVPKYEPEVEATLRRFHRGSLPKSKAQYEAIQFGYPDKSKNGKESVSK